MFEYQTVNVKKKNLEEKILWTFLNYPQRGKGKGKRNLLINYVLNACNESSVKVLMSPLT